MSSNNFLLKLHIEEGNNLIEIHLNKERHSFTFINDECKQDLIIPVARLDVLDSLFNEINDENVSNSFAIYYQKDEEKREYDLDKIAKIRDLVTCITIDEFIEMQKEIITNDYYIDSIVDYYNCVLPNELKKILSYTTNGVDFSGEGDYHLLSHEEIVSYKGPVKNFIPFIKKRQNIIGYNYKDSVYEEYKDEDKINESYYLKELFKEKDVRKEENIEILDVSYKQPKEDIEIIDAGITSDIDKEIEQVDKEYEETIKNIDYQFEKLNSGIINKEHKDIPKIVKKPKSQKEISKEVYDEAIDVLEKMKDEKDEVKNSNQSFKDAIEVLDKLNKANSKKGNNKLVIPEELEKESKKTVTKIKDKKDSSNTVLKEAVEVLEKINNRELREEKIKIKKEIVDGVRRAIRQIEETNSIIDEIDNTMEKVPEEATESDILQVNDFINNSLLNVSDNYKINFNDTQKLVIEHLPYYEISPSFDVIRIPEIEFDKITLLPDSEIKLGQLQLKVESLTNKKVDLVVKNAPYIIDENGDKLKKGSHLLIDTTNEVTLRLNKKNAMETWSLKMEKSTFEKELRNVDYSKLMKIIVSLDSYKKLGGIEKYELEKSVMLFLNFVMLYNEKDNLTELYRILDEEPTLYEEYITKYNLRHSIEMKDNLNTYEEKKQYIIKTNYVTGLIDAKWLDYPRYIFGAHKYFNGDDFLEEFISDLDDTIKEKDFSNYLKRLFKEYKMFIGLDETGMDNLDKCLEYLSLIYKYNPILGENYKYEIEREFMIGAGEEEMSLLISKLCRRGIKDYETFIEYDTMMKEKYRLGELKYPIFSESFEIDEIRNGGAYNEY